MRLVGLFHVLVVAVLFLYVGIRKTDIPLFMFPLLLGLGAVIIPYHIYKASIKKSGWVNYIHIFLVVKPPDPADLLFMTRINQ